MKRGNVFISGSTGYIAAHTTNELIERGYQVVGSARTEKKGDDLTRKLGAEHCSPSKTLWFEVEWISY